MMDPKNPLTPGVYIQSTDENATPAPANETPDYLKDIPALQEIAPAPEELHLWQQRPRRQHLL
jgi:hypothetical protein